jgi:hypothetical protein
MKALSAAILFATALLDAQAPVKRAHSVYVNELHFPGNPDLDGLVRSKLISSLTRIVARIVGLWKQSTGKEILRTLF